MASPHFQRPLVLGCILLVILPLSAGAQETRADGRGVLYSAAWGAASGLGLGIAYINPPGGTGLISDETALPLAVGLGVAGSLLAHLSGSASTAGERRPRFRAAAAFSTQQDYEFSLDYLTPVGERLSLEGAVLIMNHHRETTETQTRCSLFTGCFTANFLTEFYYRQSVAGLARLAWHPVTTRDWQPALALGGGPVRTSLETMDVPNSASTGILLDVSVGAALGTRARWSGEIGARVMPLASRDGARGASAYVRIGHSPAY
jgi:hypothetical protein